MRDIKISPTLLNKVLSVVLFSILSVILLSKNCVAIEYKITFFYPTEHKLYTDNIKNFWISGKDGIVALIPKEDGKDGIIILDNVVLEEGTKLRIGTQCNDCIGAWVGPIYVVGASNQEQPNGIEPYIISCQQNESWIPPAPIIN